MAIPRSTFIGVDGIALVTFGFVGEDVSATGHTGLGLITFGLVWRVDGVWVDVSTPSTIWTDS